jgi:hypothetical protein
MEESILTSTKKILGIGPGDTAFDLDVLTHINATFAIVNQLGVGPLDGIVIEDESTEWADLGLPQNQLSLLRTYVFLRVRSLFDPPINSFLIEAYNKQILEYETRLSYFREDEIPITNGG